MPNPSASPTPYERLELRDGIFFYRRLSRRGGALALVAPKQCVEVVHRAEHRRLRKPYDALMFFLIVFVLPSIAMGFEDATIPEVLRSFGSALVIGGFVIANVIRWPLGKGKCQTEIALTTDRGKRRLIFTRVQGEDAAFEELLDCLQRDALDNGRAFGAVSQKAASSGCDHCRRHRLAHLHCVAVERYRLQVKQSMGTDSHFQRSIRGATEPRASLRFALG